MVDLRGQIDDYLEQLEFSSEPLTALFVEAMRYSLLAGGTRVRPLLALATADVCGRPPASVLPLAAALEMIHTCSLIHDDLPALDNEELRRGKPAAHTAHGQDVALLAGDALFAEAIALALREQQGEPTRVLGSIAELAGAAGAGGLVGSQYVGVAGRSRAPRALAPARDRSLMVAAVGAVLILTGESGPDTAALRRFAAEVGVLSQIVDDVIELTPEGERTPALERARESHAIAIAALAETPRDTSTLERVADYVLACAA